MLSFWKRSLQVHVDRDTFWKWLRKMIAESAIAQDWRTPGWVRLTPLLRPGR